MVLVERDPAACDVLRRNLASPNGPFSGAEVLDKSVEDVDWANTVADAPDLLSGGPPCHPFSLGGRHRAQEDDRDMFPAAANAVRQLMPRAFVFENVRGLARPEFAGYLSYLQALLSWPSIVRRSDEDWSEHYARIRKVTGNVAHGTGGEYLVTVHSADAADYGVPQRRRRVFIIGARQDQIGSWKFPEPTHDRTRLEYEKWVSGRYWEQHPHAVRIGRPRDASLKKLEEIAEMSDTAAHARWNTVRDALKDLPDPRLRPSNQWAQHEYLAGARTYPGHTGSEWDQPAKTLKAGSHGVPGGENMVRHANGRVRYFTIREAARIQTFPDTFELASKWGRALHQLGNAVPVAMAEVIGASLAAFLESHPAKNSQTDLETLNSLASADVGVSTTKATRRNTRTSLPISVMTLGETP